MSLPPEIISRILSFLDPREVVHLRTVSKQLRDISYLPEVWRTLYANARLPRPPGPFPSQPIQFLERTLVRSEQLVHSWTTQPMRDTSCVEIPLDGSPSSVHPPKIINGRWIITLDSSQKNLVAHDTQCLDTTFRQLLWANPEPIREWDVCDATSIDEPVVYIVLASIRDEFLLSRWKLLEFRMCSTSGHLYHSISLDVPSKSDVSVEHLHGGRGRFLSLSRHQLILDTVTRQFYEFPASCSKTDDLIPGWRVSYTGVVTLCSKTHIITIYPASCHSITATFIRAFTLPTDPCANRSDSGLDLLCLSHEGFTDGHFGHIRLIRNSLVDPADGATTIRLLDQSFMGWKDGFIISCVDLALPQPTHIDTVMPMRIDIHGVFLVLGVKHRWDSPEHYIDSSDDGYARGISLFWDPIQGARQPPIRQAVRFTIDASGEKCTGDLSKLSYPEWSRSDALLRVQSFHIDCTRGMFWLPSQQSSEEKDTLALVFDVA